MSGAFAGQAQYQADILNMSEVRVSFVRHPISDATPAALAVKAEESYRTVVQAISTDEPVPAPAWLEEPSQQCASTS